MENRGKEGHYTDEELKQHLAEDKQAKMYKLPSFELVVQEYIFRLSLYALSILKHAQDAEDAVQSAFINAYYDLVANYSSERILAMNLGGWLYTITRNQALKILEKRDRLGQYYTISVDELEDEELDYLFYNISIREKTLSEHVEEQESLHELFREAFKALTENERKALVLAFIRGMKYKDVAKELNTSENNVKTLIRRARIELREYFGRLDDEKGE